MSELTARLARADRELAEVDDMLTHMIAEWRTYYPGEDRTRRISNFMGYIAPCLQTAVTLTMLVAAVERLGKQQSGEENCE